MSERKTRHTAYVVVFLDITVQPPTAIEADVFSSGAGCIASTQFSKIAGVDLFNVEADSYDEARSLAIDHINNNPLYRWVRPLMVAYED